LKFLKGGWLVGGRSGGEKEKETSGKKKKSKNKRSSVGAGYGGLKKGRETIPI